MDIRSIRDKYKMIINCESTGNNNKQNQTERQEQSEREWIKIVKNKQNKRVLTQQNQNFKNQQQDYKQIYNKKQISLKKTSHSSTYQSNILALKQKLAQSIYDSKQKCHTIDSLQTVIQKKNEQIKHLSSTISQQQQQIHQKDNMITQQRSTVTSSLIQLEQKLLIIKSHQIDNQLLKTQIQHYRKQIQSLSYKYDVKEKEYQTFHKELKKNEELKNKIERLKDDVKRLQFLLTDNQIYGQLFVSLEGKHFLGKSTKISQQLEYWYPQLLIQGVQRFLKKQKIGYGNKQFTQSIVKFIYSLLDRNQKTCEIKCKHIYNSRIKQIQRKKNHILNIMQITTNQVKEQTINKFTQSHRRNNSRLCASQLRKTTPLHNMRHSNKSKGYSICMNKNSSLGLSTTSEIKKNQSSVIPSSVKKSFLIEGLEKSIRVDSEKRKQLIIDIVESFCQGVEKIFRNSLNKKYGIDKIRELAEWFKQTVEEIFENQKKNNMFERKNKTNYNNTGKWKTVADI